jgi:hypothetical protein
MCNVVNCTVQILINGLRFNKFAFRFFLEYVQSRFGASVATKEAIEQKFKYKLINICRMK